MYKRQEPKHIFFPNTQIDVNYVHGNSAHECGYCGDKKGSDTMGFTSDFMELKHYRKLVDRGWRKCQNYYYKPDLITSACPCKWYTIRMDVTKHQIRKSHQKVYKRWLRFLSGDNTYLEKDTKIAEEKPKKIDTTKIDKTYHDLILQGITNYVKDREISFVEYLKIDKSQIPKLYSAIKISKTKENNRKDSGDFVCNVILSYFGMFKN